MEKARREKEFNSLSYSFFISPRFRCANVDKKNLISFGFFFILSPVLSTLAVTLQWINTHKIRYIVRIYNECFINMPHGSHVPFRFISYDFLLFFFYHQCIRHPYSIIEINFINFRLRNRYMHRIPFEFLILVSFPPLIW